MLRIIASDQAEQDALKLDLDALVREGARHMLLTALKAEVDEYIGQHADMRSFALGRPSWTASRLSAKTRSTPRDHLRPIHNI